MIKNNDSDTKASIFYRIDWKNFYGSTIHHEYGIVASLMPGQTFPAWIACSQNDVMSATDYEVTFLSASEYISKIPSYSSDFSFTDITIQRRAPTSIYHDISATITNESNYALNDITFRCMAFSSSLVMNTYGIELDVTDGISLSSGESFSFSGVLVSSEPINSILCYAVGDVIQ